MNLYVYSCQDCELTLAGMSTTYSCLQDSTLQTFTGYLLIMYLSDAICACLGPSYLCQCLKITGKPLLKVELYIFTEIQMNNTYYMYIEWDGHFIHQVESAYSAAVLQYSPTSIIRTIWDQAKKFG